MDVTVPGFRRLSGICKEVAHAILDGECEKGILICGTGIGISITANKFKGIRAARPAQIVLQQ